MKKILCLIVALAGISAFAEPWTEASDAFAKFFTTNGNAVFIRENKDNLIILPKAISEEYELTKMMLKS